MLIHLPEMLDFLLCGICHGQSDCLISWLGDLVYPFCELHDERMKLARVDACFYWLIAWQA